MVKLDKMSAITLHFPDDLAGLLLKYEALLPEIVERELRTLEKGPSTFDPAKYQGTEEIFEFLTGFPEAEDVLKLKASDRLQQRISHLLEKNRNEGLIPEEDEEMDYYEKVQHFAAMAKIRAAAKLGLGSAQHG